MATTKRTKTKNRALKIFNPHTSMLPRLQQMGVKYKKTNIKKVAKTPDFIIFLKQK